MLTNGAMQPWPRTLVRLAMEERICAAGTYAAFAAITKSLVTCAALPLLRVSLDEPFLSEQRNLRTMWASCQSK
eukprot:6188456-Pleurochrysis_carterae.AAC.4